LEYSAAADWARQFICVSSNPQGGVQYDEFWTIYDPKTETAHISYTVSINNQTANTHIITVRVNYTGYTDKIQLIADVSVLPTRVRLTTVGLKIG
jgi:hypothetical protein